MEESDFIVAIYYEGIVNDKKEFTVRNQLITGISKKHVFKKLMKGELEKLEWANVTTVLSIIEL